MITSLITCGPLVLPASQRCALVNDRLPSKRRVILGFIAAPLIQIQTRDALAAERGNARPKFYELEGSGGVKALELRPGSGEPPNPGDEVLCLNMFLLSSDDPGLNQVAIHYYGRLAAKQGWRFDTTYDHKDASGIPQPFVFTVGSKNVIPGLDSTVKKMKPGSILRVIIPPSQGYQNTTQEPLPPNVFDRQRLFTTIFNPTRVANGEGSTLGTLVFDVELVRVITRGN